jgi:hypothetical protein
MTFAEYRHGYHYVTTGCEVATGQLGSISPGAVKKTLIKLSQFFLKNVAFQARSPLRQGQCHRKVPGSAGHGGNVAYIDGAALPAETAPISPVEAKMSAFHQGITADKPSSGKYGAIVTNQTGVGPFSNLPNKGLFSSDHRLTTW